MKFESAFKDFLENVVNLNPTRYATAETGIDTMKGIIKNNELFGGKFIDIKPQGSFRQGTIIKPVDSDLDFDVDLLFEMKPVEGWEPADYPLKLANEFRKLERYKDKVDTRGKTRCVTIDYESDFHIDMVPAITLAGGQQVIMNKTTNAYEATDGDGYAKWFDRQNAITGKKHLTKVVRLLKYIRDSQGSFEVKSVLLTTVVGGRILSTDVQSRDYPDLPTAFLTIITRLDQYLQANPNMPIVVNPVLPSEDFNRKWNQAQYSKFREKIHEYAQAAGEAYHELDEAKSLKKWKKIFGDAFTVPTGVQGLVGRALSRDPGEQFLSDFGISENLSSSLQVDAKVEQDGYRPFFLRGSGFPLKKKRKLTFTITGNFPPNSSIKWKVKNFDTEAKDAEDLRGDIVDDRGFLNKIEHTKYTGSHYVECYAIIDGVCVAKDRLTVPIANAL